MPDEPHHPPVPDLDRAVRTIAAFVRTFPVVLAFVALAPSIVGLILYTNKTRDDINEASRKVCEQVSVLAEEANVRRERYIVLRDLVAQSIEDIADQGSLDPLHRDRLTRNAAMMRELTVAEVSFPSCEQFFP